MSASEGGRYLNALRYYAPIVLALAALVAGATYGVFNADQQDYEATVRIARQEAVRSDAPANGPAQAREMETLAELVTTRPVLSAAADQIANESEATLRKRVRASVDSGTNILRIVVEDDVPEEAAAIAGVVSSSFQAVSAGIRRDHLESVREDLDRQIRATTSPDVAAVLRAQQREVAANEALAGSDLYLVEGPVPPKARPPSSAVPEAGIAFAAVLILGFAAALLRELLVPHLTTSRQLSALLGLEVLAVVPRNPRRLGRHSAGRTAAEEAAYQRARSRLEQDLRRDSPQIIVLTSALGGEGKTTATANLGRAFAEAGSRVLIVGGDTRNDDLASAFSVKSKGGFSDLVAKSGTTRGGTGDRARSGPRARGAIGGLACRRFAKEARCDLRTRLSLRHSQVCTRCRTR